MYEKNQTNGGCNKNNNSTSSFSINKNILPQKNLKYFPIESNNNQENNIIYLVAEDIPDLELNNKNQNNFINSTNNRQHKKIKRNYSTNNFNSINNLFIPYSLQKEKNKDNINNYNFNSNKKIIHSYSVDNYSSITNKAFDILGNNLTILENSKIMEKNFINGIKDKKRKDNLLNALNIYKKYKSLGEINKVNRPFNYETENNNRKNMSKIKTIINQKNGYNIILEDENENCENTINSKKNENIINNNKIYYNKNKDIQKLINNKTNQKNNIINNRNHHKFLKNSNSVNYLNTEINSKLNILQQQKYEKHIPKVLNKVYSKNFNSGNKNINININNNINNNININNNFSINNHQKPGKILIRKSMLEEKYIIDEDGHKKLLEKNQQKIPNENQNIPRKIRYHRNNPKIIVINDNNAKKNDVIKRYYRNNMSQINNNSFIKSKTSCNSIKKEKNITKRINNIPIPLNKIFHRNNNINTSLIKNQTSQNRISTNYHISLINNINNEINNNHYYHEIKHINKKSKKKDSKTIYHDYANITKDIIFNNINENKNIKNASYKNILTRNNSKSYYSIHSDNKYSLKNKSERNINNNRVIYRNINHNLNKIPYNNNIYLTDYNENMNYYNKKEEFNNIYMEKNYRKPKTIFYYYKNI